MFNIKYPYVNDEVLNLDWVLKQIKEFEKKLLEWEEVAKELQKALGDINAMKAEIAAIQRAIADLGDIRRMISELQKAQDNQQEQITILVSKLADVKTYLDGIDERFINVYKYIDEKIKIIEHSEGYDLEQLKAMINSVDFKLQKEIDLLIKRLDDAAVDVYNPIASMRVDFDINNKFVYRDLAGNFCPTAEEYIRKGLTAEEYALYNLKAYDYFKRGFKMLHMDHVFMPHFGVMQEVSNCMTAIVNLIFGTFTAAEYADLHLSAEDYTEMGLTAYEYVRANTHGKGLTADEYAALNILNSGIINHI